MRPTRVLAGGLIAALAVVILGTWKAGPGEARSQSDRSVVVGSVTTSSVPRDPVSSASVTTRPAGLVDVVRRGLSAWGRFAVTGDLGEVELWFATDGPQYARFVDEAGGARVGGPAYSVDLQSPEVEVKGSTAFVRGQVTFARAEEPSRSYDWTVVLERREESWVIWTVKPG